MASGLFGRGNETTVSESERRQQQSQDRYEDANRATRPGDVNLADVKAWKRRG